MPPTIEMFNNNKGNKSNSSIAYKITLEKENTQDGARIIWNDRLNIDLSVEEWEGIRCNSYYSTLVTKLW